MLLKVFLVARKLSFLVLWIGTAYTVTPFLDKLTRLHLYSMYSSLDRPATLLDPYLQQETISLIRCSETMFTPANTSALL